MELTYHLPPVGTITTTLYNESEIVYRFFHGTGELDRLKNLDHLGAIKLAWEGAHHSRWEYIAFMFALIDRCAEIEEIHIRSEVKLCDNERVSSGRELLKCWAFLLNVGHLSWTFTSERALMFELLSEDNRDLRELLIKEYFSKDKDLEKWATNIIDNGDFYKFYQVLSFVRLHHLTKKNKLKIPWEKCLKLYVLNDISDKISRLKDIYHQIRRIAYLSLDSHYTPSIVLVDYRQILSDKSSLSSLINDFLRERKDELRPVEHYLYRNIYLGEPVLREIACREASLREKIRQNLKEKSLESLIKTINRLARGKLQHDIRKQPLETIIRLPIPFLHLTVREIQQKFETYNKIHATVWNIPGGQECIVQVHAKEKDVESQVQACYVGIKFVIENITEEVSKSEWDNEQLSMLILTSVLNLLVKNLLGKNLRWEWIRVGNSPLALMGSIKEIEKKIDEILKKNSFPPDIEAEFESKKILLKNSLSNYNDNKKIVLSLGRLQAYGKEKNKQGKEKEKQVLELDGVFVELDDSDQKIILKLMEAKRQYDRSAETTARKALKVKIEEKIGFGGRYNLCSDSCGKIGLAWSSIVLPMEN